MRERAWCEKPERSLYNNYRQFLGYKIEDSIIEAYFATNCYASVK